MAPDYFEWDYQKSGGVSRRVIRRITRPLVNQQPALTYEWIGCTAAQVLTEIEQQLSMLVQGLVKARSDAVDGDGAMALPWLRWTNELTTASDRFPVSLPVRHHPQRSSPAPVSSVASRRAQGRAVVGRGRKDGQADGRMGDDRGTHRVGSVRGARSTPTERQ